MEGFEGIIRSKQMWLNDLTQSNDPRDIVMGLDTVRELVHDVRHSEFEGHIGFPISMLMGSIEGYYANYRLYTACFTPVRDDINMWREYAARGSGVSIGFRARSLLDMHGRIYNVRYVQDDTRAVLRDILVDLFSPLLRGHDLPEEQTSLFQSLTFATELISMINSIKHHSWSYERELRLTYAEGTPTPGLDIPLSMTAEGEEVFYTPPLARNRGNHQVLYHSQPFGKYNNGAFDPSGAIEQVVLGPHCELSDEYVRELMEHEGYRNVRVARSECKFRA